MQLGLGFMRVFKINKFYNKKIYCILIALKWYLKIQSKN